MKNNFFYILFSLLCFFGRTTAFSMSQYSTTGFWLQPNTGRSVMNMNPGWRFLKADEPDAYKSDFDDSDWQTVSLPHGLEYLPAEASGCINYQGVAWYRKHFSLGDTLKGKKSFIHFEAIMGKSKVYLNGILLKEHFGGFLPCIVDVSDILLWGKENILAVMTDNSDDFAYPPGKPQHSLDFAYFGGIYRDCWLVSHNHVYITDSNLADAVAGGGLFVSYNRISKKSADLKIQLHLKNETQKNFKGRIIYELFDQQGKSILKEKLPILLKADTDAHFTTDTQVPEPALWSPDNPSLYMLHIVVTDQNNQIVDGYRQRIGIRSIEFRGKQGFYLNGVPYPYPLIGVNRHQDFGLIGNAVPNNLHWRDAKKMRDAGVRVIRNAHYPQDPAFMDACDELGLFVIENTPGWQFWNPDPIFEQRVYSDIRQIVRRERNRPSVLLWEPILNETNYPDYFAKNTRDIVEQEYPYASCYCASDVNAKGKEHFSILFEHPEMQSDGTFLVPGLRDDQCSFTREFGDNVDDWSSHNSPSRVNKSWGEGPMRIQAAGYASTPYPFTSYDALYRTTRQHFGGCLWHSFDHQRGYHPDPFYGGLMDVFRQPKYSYYLFQSQRPAEVAERNYKTGPMIFIAHEMTPFSGADVPVYTNCDEVHLTYCTGGKTHVIRRTPLQTGIPYPIFTFEGVYDFMKDKELSFANRQGEVYLLAEGFIQGKKVAEHRREPARRPEKLLLFADDENKPLVADDSDIMVVIAAIADGNGNIKRLNNYAVHFTIEGEGRILGDEAIGANPRSVEWGTAPVLIQSTHKAGKIKILASVEYPGSQMPVTGTLEIESVTAPVSLLYSEPEMNHSATISLSRKQTITDKDIEIERLRNELNKLRLKEVEKQQTDFGEKKF